MTRDEILNMPAGREMDALIAEKVMGWHRGHPKYYMDGKETSLEYWLDEQERGDYTTGETFDCDLNEWHPSEDIAAAWEVVEKLRFFVMPWGNDEWCVSPERDKHLAFQKIVDAPTAPLAICRAALLAVMEEE